MHKLGRTLAIGTVGLGLILSATACGDSGDKADAAAERIIEQQGGGKVDVDSDAGTVEVANDDGTLTSGRNELPKDWPEDVEVPDGLEIVFTSTTGDEATGIVTNVVAESALTPKEVVEGFEDTLDGWEVTDHMDWSDDSTATLSVGFEKEGRSVAVAAIGGGDGHTQVSINHETAH